MYNNHARGKHLEEEVKMKYDFSLEACYEAVRFEVEVVGTNVFEALGRAIVRAEQDVSFNNTMIEAYKKYINDHDLGWDD